MDKRKECAINPPASVSPPDAPTASNARVRRRRTVSRASRLGWIKPFVQPLLLLAAGAALIAGLGVAQRLGWISAGGSGATHVSSTDGESARYICPMMCTPPQAEPGRCPVCAMELVPATSGSGESDSRSVQIDPVARRLANIRTAAVTSMSVERTIRAVGELNYNEGTLKTISAYVDGRLDRLYADYTGVVVEKGDHLALLYSPRLYSAQVELLLAKEFRSEREKVASSRDADASRGETRPRVADFGIDLYQSAKQKLLELGMTEEQIGQLEEAGKADSRMHVCAPIGGTVIEKLAVEGQYVKEGQAIYHVADLSTVWLMLELFPEDAAAVRDGQKVEAEVQSLPGRVFTGRVAFRDPMVDPAKRTVGVRVVIANDDGVLCVGDYTKATIQVPLAIAGGAAHVVPRSAVLMNAGHSVVYVETEPGRFEIRCVVLGPTAGDQIVVLEGLSEGEQVATAGNFLIDSQMQLSGNPSLIDPTRAAPPDARDIELPPIGEMELASPVLPEPRLGGPSSDSSESLEITAAMSKLSPADRRLAEQQRVCPVADMPLGSMGPPIKVIVEGHPVFICCEGCRERLLAEPTKYLAKLGTEAAR